MAEIDALLVRIDASTESLRRQLGSATNQVSSFERNVNTHLDRVNKSFNAMGVVARRAFLVIGGFHAARGFIDLLDTTNRLAQRLANVTKGADDLRATQGRLFDVSQKTGTSLESTVELYVRLAQATEQLNLGQDRLVALSTAVQEALRISGASTSEAAAGVIQLGQALGSGRLQGDELRSLGENANRLIKAIVEGLHEVAPELNATRGNLKQLGQEGVLTSGLIVRALQTQFRVLDAEFSRLPDTLEMGWTRLQNQVLKSVGVMDDGANTTKALNRALNQLRQVVADPNFTKGMQAIGIGIAAVADATARAVIYLGRLRDLFENFDLGKLAKLGFDSSLGGILYNATAPSDAQSIQALVNARRRTAAQTYDQVRVRFSSEAAFEAAKRDALADLDRQLREATGNLFRGAGSDASAGVVMPRVDVIGAGFTGGGGAGNDNGPKTTKDGFDQVVAAVRRLHDEQERLAQQAIEESRTPWESYNARLAELQELYDGNHLSAEQFARSVEYTTEQFAKADPVAQAATEALRRYDDQQKEMAVRAAQVVEAARTPIEKYQAQLRELAEDRAWANQHLQGEQLRITLEAIDRQTRSLNPAFKELSDFGEQAFDRVGQAMTQSAVQGGTAWQRAGNIIMGVLSELQQELFKLAVINPLKNKLFNQSSPTLGGLIGNFLFDFANPGVSAKISAPGAGLGGLEGGVVGMRAAGGPVSAGRPYIVGERGPELLVPTAPGVIVPNGGFGGGSAANTNVAIVIHDERGAHAAPIEQRETRNGDGMRQVDLFIRDRVDAQLQGQGLTKGMRTYGARKTLQQMG